MWAYLDDFSPDYMIEYILVSRRADLEASREAPPQLGTGDTDSELESELAHLGQELERYSYEELREEYGKVVTENIQRGVYEVDLFYWARLSYWTPDEAAALASGYEPRIVTRSLISNLPYHRITQHYNDLWEHIRRAQEAGRGLSERMTPSEVLGWAETNGVEYPDSLVKAVSKFGDRGPTSLDDLPSCIQQLEAENERLQRKVAELEAEDQSLTGNKLVRMSLYKLVIGMAMHSYGLTTTTFFENNKRTEVVGKIIKSLPSQLHLDDKTVRGHLKHGLQLLSEKFGSKEIAPLERVL